MTPRPRAQGGGQTDPGGPRHGKAARRRQGARTPVVRAQLRTHQPLIRRADSKTWRRRARTSRPMADRKISTRGTPGGSRRGDATSAASIPDSPADRARRKAAAIFSRPSADHEEEPTRTCGRCFGARSTTTDSRDLDQLSAGGSVGGRDRQGAGGVADVDAAVPRDRRSIEHAARNTTSVYTPRSSSPMLPERLSDPDLTRSTPIRIDCGVIEFVISPDGG